MKVLRFTFLYLIIYILNSTFVNAQNLGLEIIGENAIETLTIDSLNLKKAFIDYSSLKKEIDSTYFKLQRRGYIESELMSIDKKNDSLFVAKIHLNKKYDSIYIYYNNNYINEELLNEISSNFTNDYFSIPISESEKALEYLNNKVSENGMPFVSFQLKNITKKSNNDLQGELIVYSTKTRLINNIIIKDYSHRETAVGILIISRQERIL